MRISLLQNSSIPTALTNASENPFDFPHLSVGSWAQDLPLLWKTHHPQAILCLLKWDTLLPCSLSLNKYKPEQEPKPSSQGRWRLHHRGILTLLLCRSRSALRGNIVIERIYARSVMQSKCTGFNSAHQRMEITLHFQHQGRMVRIPKQIQEIFMYTLKNTCWK